MGDHEDTESDAGPLLLRAIEDQLKSRETPEVKREFDRLVSLGIPADEAKEMMATVLSSHVARMQGPNATFDYPAYVTELGRLPDDTSADAE